MRDLRSPERCRAVMARVRSEGESVGFVPTMGALHRGHMLLVHRARRECDYVVASIFVNPAQFGPREDFSRYPRAIDRDRKLLRDAGVDLLYAPYAKYVYPPGFSTWIEPPKAAERWEGAWRPGHFRGVCTVVAKLFNAVHPDRAYFGEKDFQQLRVIEDMSRDLDLGVRIVPVPTVRDSDGLALSSRNARLSGEERGRALGLRAAVFAALAAVREGVASAREVERRMRATISKSEPSRLDYAAVVDPRTLEPAASCEKPTRAIVAAVYGRTRLIDNCRLPGVSR